MARPAASADAAIDAGAAIGIPPCILPVIEFAPDGRITGVRLPDGTGWASGAERPTGERPASEGPSPRMVPRWSPRMVDRGWVRAGSAVRQHVGALRDGDGGVGTVRHQTVTEPMTERRPAWCRSARPHSRGPRAGRMNRIDSSLVSAIGSMPTTVNTA